MELRLGSPLESAASEVPDGEQDVGGEHLLGPRDDAQEPPQRDAPARHLRGSTNDFVYGGAVRPGRGWRVDTAIGKYLPSGTKVATVLGVLALAWFVRNFDRSVPAAPRERLAVVTAEDLARSLRGFTPDPRAETLVKRTRLFGADGVEYRYRPTDPSDADAPRITCRAMVHADEEGARRAHALSQVNLLTDFRLERRGEVGLVEQHDAVRFGDEVRAFRVQEGRTPVGHSVAVRQGERTFYLAFTGAVFATDAELERLVDPALRALLRLDP